MTARKKAPCVLTVYDIDEVRQDDFLTGARFAVIVDRTLHVSPAMKAAIDSEPSTTWKALRAIRADEMTDGVRHNAKGEKPPTGEPVFRQWTPGQFIEES